jgi:hypothetical protein
MKWYTRIWMTVLDAKMAFRAWLNPSSWVAFDTKPDVQCRVLIVRRRQSDRRCQTPKTCMETTSITASTESTTTKATFSITAFRVALYVTSQSAK